MSGDCICLPGGVCVVWVGGGWVNWRYATVEAELPCRLMFVRDHLFIGCLQTVSMADKFVKLNKGINVGSLINIRSGSG